ncbi:MAG TPA: hypothetical protein DD412_02130 [Holosporales bacterium]|nr:hypothetical protein [Holosporales bacterium]
MINFTDLFKGSWRFERNVKGLFPQPLDFEGRAQFVQKDAYRFYEESGAYALNDQQIDFATSYLYQFVDQTHCRVLFSDQRFFYELTQSPQNIEHLCGQDHYKGHFEQLSKDHWRLNWHISGPRKKNSQITTCYFRA